MLQAKPERLQHLLDRWWVALGGSKGHAPEAPAQKCLLEFLSVCQIISSGTTALGADT
jgi:hypothetical protein